MNMKYIKKYIGFTLIELVITIAIIIILSMISVPVYRMHVLKAKRAEGYILLNAIREAQMLYRSEHKCFLTGTNSSIKADNVFSCKEDVLGIDARTNKYFTSFIFSVFYYGPQDCFTACVKSADAGVMTLIYSKTMSATYK